MKTRLDAAVVAAAECPPGRKRLDIYCTHTKGLLLEVRPSGGKTYHVRYTDQHGAIRQVKVARADQVTFAQARKAAEQLIAAAALGQDPGAKKAEKRAVPLYAELARQHLADAKLTARSYSTIEGYVRNHIVPAFGRIRVSDIDSRAVAQWLAEKRAGGMAPATALKLKMILSRSYELGARWAIPGCERNPTKGVRLPPLNNARERFLSADEAARLRVATAQSKNTQLAFIVDLLLYSGARVRELLDACWENVDIERRQWLIPTSKTGKARRVPLSSAALDIIAALPRFDGCPWLVPNPDTRKPFVSIKHGWQAAREAAGLPGLRIHDLRHSAASFMVNSGVDLFAVGKVLGHASYQSTQRYAHLANDTLLAAVEAGAAKQTQPAAA